MIIRSITNLSRFSSYATNQNLSLMIQLGNRALASKQGFRNASKSLFYKFGDDAWRYEIFKNDSNNSLFHI